MFEDAKEAAHCKAMMKLEMRGSFKSAKTIYRLKHEQIQLLYTEASIASGKSDAAKRRAGKNFYVESLEELQAGADATIAGQRREDNEGERLMCARSCEPIPEFEEYVSKMILEHYETTKAESAAAAEAEGMDGSGAVNRVQSTYAAPSLVHGSAPLSIGLIPKCDAAIVAKSGSAPNSAPAHAAGLSSLLGPRDDRLTKQAYEMKLSASTSGLRRTVTRGVAKVEAWFEMQRA